MESQSQRGFFGIIIAKDILENRELSVTEKFIYGYIASFQRCCFESNEKIAARLGISESLVRHAIPKLARMGYLAVEKPNNNNRSRRIYDVFNNPKKKKYLDWKYQPKACGKHVENSEGVVQEMHDTVQNLHYKITGVSSAKYAHIDIEENKKKVENEQKPNCPPAGLAGLWPASRLAVKRQDFESEIDFEKAFYKRNTICLGAH